jgi:pyruvate dehydrogenase E1 component
MAGTPIHDGDRTETQEWIDSLQAVAQTAGRERAMFLLGRLIEWGQRNQIVAPFTANTAYVNTIPAERQPPYPGDRAIERRIKSLIRWNAMAMVVRANRRSAGIGGHISTFASAATLLEVGFEHFFRGNTPEQVGDRLAFGQNPIRLSELTDDLLRAMPLALHRESSLPRPGAVRLS